MYFFVFYSKGLLVNFDPCKNEISLRNCTELGFSSVDRV